VYVAFGMPGGLSGMPFKARWHALVRHTSQEVAAIRPLEGAIHGGWTGRRVAAVESRCGFGPANDDAPAAWPRGRHSLLVQ